MWIERRAFLGVVPGLLALAARPARGQDAASGVWCGAVTASGATVTVLGDGAGVPIELELTDGASPPSGATQPTDAHGVATFVLDGLRERTPYHYAVTTPQGMRGNLEVPGMRLELAVARCTSTQSTPGRRVLTAPGPPGRHSGNHRVDHLPDTW